jgi:hypothetical protein
MPRPPPARPPPTPLGHSPRRRGAAPMPQPLFAGPSSRQHPDPRVPDHAATAPPESSGQPLPSSTHEQIVSERWKKPQSDPSTRRSYLDSPPRDSTQLFSTRLQSDDRRRRHRTIHRRCLLLVCPLSSPSPSPSQIFYPNPNPDCYLFL